MAHDVKDIQRRDCTQASTAGRVVSHHVCVTNDARADTIAAGYFNSSRAKLVLGDSIQIHSDMGGTPKLSMVIVTASPASGNVTVAAVLAEDITA